MANLEPPLVRRLTEALLISMMKCRDYEGRLLPLSFAQDPLFNNHLAQQVAMNLVSQGVKDVTPNWKINE